MEGARRRVVVVMSKVGASRDQLCRWCFVCPSVVCLFPSLLADPSLVSTIRPARSYKVQPTAPKEVRISITTVSTVSTVSTVRKPQNEEKKYLFYSRGALQVVFFSRGSPPPPPFFDYLPPPMPPHSIVGVGFGF